jgi:O-antigen/teichoic acid export membrane protein
MKSHFNNIFYGMLDYAVYPLAMLLVAPMILRNLGTAAYGLWSVMTAVVSIGSILAAGFGDANIQHVSEQRGLGDREKILSAVRTLLGCNVLLAAMAATTVLLLSAIAADRIVPETGVSRSDCIQCFWLAAALIALRAVESVCISTQRAYERYGAAVRVSIGARLISVLAGTGLTRFVGRVSMILVVTVIVSALGTAWQFHHLRQLLGVRKISPSWNFAESKSFFHFGMYSWLIAASGLAFSQFDRVILGVWAGAAPVASYALCTQLAQPIYGLVAAGLHILFPYLASRADTGSEAVLHRVTVLATVCNWALVVSAAVLLWAMAPRLLSYLGHNIFEHGKSRLLAPTLISSALLGLSVCPTYAMFAYRQIRTVAVVNVLGAALSIACMLVLGRLWGAMGIAYARLVYGAATLYLYVPMWRILRRMKPSGLAIQTCEDV